MRQTAIYAIDRVAYSNLELARTIMNLPWLSSTCYDKRSYTSVFYDLSQQTPKIIIN